jgi:carboxyl-terminal processing protease
MNDAKRSLTATFMILIVIGVVVSGALVRNRMEVGAGMSVGSPVTMDSIVSSQTGRPEVTETATDPFDESTFFYQLTLLLEANFVDPIGHDQSLATGAIRGMVASLADSYSSFYDIDQMKAFNGRLEGSFEGIGVELRLVYNEEDLRKFQDATIGAEDGDEQAAIDPRLLIPTVMVSTVIPGSSADIAGIKAGDRITKIDSKWVVSSLEVKYILDRFEAFQNGEITSKELQAIDDEFSEKAENLITPNKATDRLTLAKDSVVELQWQNPEGEVGIATVARKPSSLKAVDLQGNKLELRFLRDAAEQLSLINLPKGDLIIDLRQSTVGDYEVMRDCLEFLAAPGDYGFIERSQAGEHRKLTVSTGAKVNRKFKLIVDESTWGASAIFAAALVSKGVAEIADGKLTEDLSWVEKISLPDGSGYTLKTGVLVTTMEVSE